MTKTIVKFVCQNCGNEFSRWQGRCSGCGEWNTITEERVTARKNNRSWITDASTQKPVAITDIKASQEERFSTGIPELDRVLGGGISTVP